ncbi:MAG: hypothetical protein ACYC64_14430 [Armatimonadota bacterium]
MTNPKCPGQDMRYWKPEDIYEEFCPNCGGRIEFFKDDLRHKCPGCGKYAINPKNDMACAAWCKHAKECLEQLGRLLPDEETT